MQESLIESAYTRDRAALLTRANLGLEKLRFWLRLAKDLHLIAFAQYEHGARLIDALGRQVGGWLRAERGGNTGAAQEANNGTAPR